MCRRTALKGTLQHFLQLLFDMSSSSSSPTSIIIVILAEWNKTGCQLAMSFGAGALSIIRSEAI